MTFRNRSTNLPTVMRGLLGDQIDPAVRNLLIYVQPATRFPVEEREDALRQLSLAIDRVPSEVIDA